MWVGRWAEVKYRLRRGEPVMPYPSIARLMVRTNDFIEKLKAALDAEVAEVAAAKAAPKGKAKAKGKPDRSRPSTPNREPSTTRDKPKFPEIGIRSCRTLFSKGKLEAHEKGECKRGEHLSADEVWKRWEERRKKRGEKVSS